jgi:hypothetical protein
MALGMYMAYGVCVCAAPAARGTAAGVRDVACGWDLDLLGHWDWDWDWDWDQGPQRGTPVHGAAWAWGMVPHGAAWGMGRMGMDLQGPWDLGSEIRGMSPHHRHRHRQRHSTANCGLQKTDSTHAWMC